MRGFHLNRREDISGVSGTGRIAEGVEFSDGTTVLRWVTSVNSTVVYDSLLAVKLIHGHGGATVIVPDWGLWPQDPN